MLLDDTAVRHCGIPDEVAAGLDAFLDAQPPIDEADIDAMFVAEMQRLDAERRDVLAMHDETVRMLKAAAA